MGVDLKLLIVCNFSDMKGGYAHTLLEMDRRKDLWDEIIEKLDEVNMPKGFELYSYVAKIPDGKWQGERGYGQVKETPYGEPLTYVKAGELATVIREYNSKSFDSGTKRNRGLVAYLECLDKDTLVVLYWH